jgi:hypothetical protein
MYNNLFQINERKCSLGNQIIDDKYNIEMYLKDMHKQFCEVDLWGSQKLPFVGRCGQVHEYAGYIKCGEIFSQLITKDWESWNFVTIYNL